MIELIYAFIRKVQLAHPEGSPRIEAIIGVCIVLAPVCFAAMSIVLNLFGISAVTHGPVRLNPIYWAAIATSAALAVALCDHRISEIDSKYEDMHVPATLAKKIPFIALLIAVGLGFAFLAFRWPVVCVVTFSVMEISVRWGFREHFR